MTEIGKEYGGALHELCAEEGLTEEAGRQLALLRDAFRENPDFLRLLGNLSMPKEQRVGILSETFGDRLHPYVLSFLKILTERGAASAFRECADAFAACYNRDHQVVEAVVTTARPLTEEQREKLIEKIRAMTGRQPALKEKTDESLLGGVLLQMDGKRYDNTVKSRLAAIRQSMTAQ